MQYTKLGNSELTVSRICMGCMGYQNGTSEEYLGRAIRSMAARESHVWQTGDKS